MVMVVAVAIAILLTAVAMLGGSVGILDPFLFACDREFGNHAVNASDYRKEDGNKENMLNERMFMTQAVSGDE
jgi:hypothetical protein